MAQRVLVVDVGGTHLKILATGQRTPRKIVSGPKMTAELMCKWVRKAASDWLYDVATVGYPAPVVHGKPVHEPYNLGKGWVGFDYAKGLGCPVKVLNDAAIHPALPPRRRSHRWQIIFPTEDAFPGSAAARSTSPGLTSVRTPTQFAASQFSPTDYPLSPPGPPGCPVVSESQAVARC